MIVPSKFYSILAAGRPSIAIMAYDGEIARMITKYNCGVVIQPGHAQELAETILRLSNDPHSLAAMGQSARLALDSHFTQQRALDSWRDILSRRSLATAAEKV
jgi:glycosyltransferase involved in cell wall biosynthesis